MTDRPFYTVRQVAELLGIRTQLAEARVLATKKGYRGIYLSTKEAAK